MGELKIINTSVPDFLLLLEELKSIGLILNKDFEWRFQPSKVIETFDDTWKMENQHWIIKFYDPKQLTFYTLKWHSMTI
jgi:hypothetical protein